MEQKWDQLASEGAGVLVDGLRSADWERVRDRFAEWFDRRGQDECVYALRGLGGPAEISGTEQPVWRSRLSEGLADAWDLDGADELTSLIEELGRPRGFEAPVGAVPRNPARRALPDPVPGSAFDSALPRAGDRFDFQGITINGQFVGVQHVQQAPGDAPGAATGRSVSTDWPSAENMEPLTYGVRRTRRGKGLPQLPPYVARDADPEVNSAVQSAAAEGGLVVVRGEAYAGKSRTALAAMAEVLPGVRVFAPARHENLRELPGLLRGLAGERCAVWLDDLDGHLGDGGLEPRLLAQLRKQGVPVVATMREDAYDEYRQTSRGRVFDLAHIADLPRDWSHAERKRAGEAEDPRLVEAARQCGAEGVAAYLAVGPMLWEEWQRARRADRHPRGYALVRAAVDLARCGLRGPLALDLLVNVHEAYAAVPGMERESVDDALAWAGEKRHGVLRLLRRNGANTWEAAPYLVDTASQDETLPAVDGAVWGVALEVARADSAYDAEVVVAGARGAFRAAAESGDGRAMHNLGLLEESLGDRGEAETWFRRAAEAGQSEAAGRLGRMLSERGDTRDAEPFLETAAGAGDHVAATLLGKALRDRAAEWLEEGKRLGNPEAAHLLGDLHLGSGEYDLAERCYAAAEERGYPDVARSMGALLILGGADEAAKVWLSRAAASDDEAASDLLDILEGAPEGTDGYFLGSGNYPLDHTHLGALLEEQGRLDGAREKYRQGYLAGDAYGAYRLAVLLEKDDQPEKAKAWYRKAAGMGHLGAQKALGEKPAAPDTVTE